MGGGSAHACYEEDGTKELGSVPCDKSRNKVVVRTRVSTSDRLKCGSDNGEWFINKLSGSRVIKSSSTADKKGSRVRSLEDILMQSQVPYQETECTYPIRDEVVDVKSAEQSRCKESVDDDHDNDQMTLQELRLSVKKSRKRSVKVQSSPSSYKLDRGPQESAGQKEATICGMELRLDVSSSINSEDLSNSIDNDGITSSHKLDDSPQEATILAPENGVKEIISRKRKIDSCLESVQLEVPMEDGLTEDDELTLHMWQSRLKRPRQKKSKRSQDFKLHSISEDHHKIESHHASLPLTDAKGSVSCNLDWQIKKSEPDSMVNDGDNLVMDQVDQAADLFTTEQGAELSAGQEKSDWNEKHECGHATINTVDGSIPNDEPGSVPCDVMMSSWILKPCSKLLPTSTSISVDLDAGLVSEANIVQTCDDTHMGCRLGHASPNGRKVVEEKADKFAGTMATSALDNAGVTGDMLSSQTDITIKEQLEKLSQCRQQCDSLLVQNAKEGINSLAAESAVEHAGQAIDVRSEVENPCIEESSEMPSGEKIRTREDQGLAEPKPAKLPCKRKVISPLSREKLLWASRHSELGFSDLEGQPSSRGFKKFASSHKLFNGLGGLNHVRFDLSYRKKILGIDQISESSSPPKRVSSGDQASAGSPSHNRLKPFFLKTGSFKVTSQSPSPPANHSTVAAASSQQQFSQAPKLSLVLNSSPSPPPQGSKSINGTPPGGTSPPIPAKGILRTSSQACQGPCRCEECDSVRSRAERASEFSQQQMHDIEGLAVKLMKELRTMRSIVEDKVIQSSSKFQSPRSSLSMDQVRMATNSAFEMEEKAKKWLVRMARDCNRYCKIMRMQQRRLSFADESGGQLCHVKMFHSLQSSVHNGDASEASVEGSSSLDKVEDLQ